MYRRRRHRYAVPLCRGQSTYVPRLEPLEDRVLLAADLFEPNDSFAGAFDLGNGDQRHDELTVHDSFNDDWYRWTATGSGRLTVDIFFDDDLGDLDLELYDSNQTRVALSDTVSDNEKVSRDVVGGLTYFVRVFGYNGVTQNDYDLAIDGAEPPIAVDRFEPNDAFDQAAGLGSADQIQTGLNVHSPLNDDWYQWTADANGTLTVDVSFEHSEGNVDVELYDASQQIVASSRSLANNEHVSDSVSFGQTYYVRVFGSSGAMQKSYGLRIDGPELNIPADRFEPNDMMPQASSLGTADQSLDGLSIHRPLNEDWYRWSATQDGTVGVQVEFDHALGDLNVELYDAQRRILDGSTSTTDSEQVSADVQSGQTVFVRVFGVDGATQADYRLTLSRSTPWEPNDTSSHAIVLGSGDQAHLGLAIDRPGDEDWFQWTASRNGRLTVDVLFADAKGDLDVQLYDSTATLLHESDTLSDNEQVVTDSIAGQTYFIRIIGFGGETNAYDMVIRGPGASSADMIGVFRPENRNWYVDSTGNGRWDGSSADSLFRLGIESDVPVVGDWNNDGFDEIGVFRPANRNWYLDSNGNGHWDGSAADTLTRLGIAGDLPVVGDWNNDGIDDIGVFRPANRNWYLDSNGNGAWDGSSVDTLFRFGAEGDLPVVGDWNNDGVDDIGVFRPANHNWLLDTNGNGTWDGATVDAAFYFAAEGDLPLVGDWNHDGIDDVGLFDSMTRKWLLDTNGNRQWDGLAVDSRHRLGMIDDLPVVGKWTPTSSDSDGIYVTPRSGLETSESGGTASFEVMLESPPLMDVTVPIKSADTTEGTMSAAALVFTLNNWNIPQTVTVTGVNDAEQDDDVDYEIVIGPTASGDPVFNSLKPPKVQVTNRDDDDANSVNDELYFSVDSGAIVGGLRFGNNDVVAYDGSGFRLLFDGSDVGLGNLGIDALDVISNTEILVSFNAAGTIPGIPGIVDDSDIVKFTAKSLGDETGGTFELYFDGSDVGLTSVNEDVKGITLTSDGMLLISTVGSVEVDAITARAEDILAFSPTSLGGATSGTWSLYFDGSDVGLDGKNVDAFAVDSSGITYLSTSDSLLLTDVSGADEDVFVFRPTSTGATTAGLFDPGLFFRGGAHGLSKNDITAIDTGQ